MTAQPAVLEDYIARYSRWGLWGPDDQLGAMNLVGRCLERQGRSPDRALCPRVPGRHRAEISRCAASTEPVRCAAGRPRYVQ